MWGVSVMCDFEHDVATVHRIVHSSFIKESSMRWIPLQDFNKQIDNVAKSGMIMTDVVR